MAIWKSRHRHRHWHRHRHSNINIGCYNSLHVISNKVATYRLEACDFIRKCFAKISRRKFSDNLKRVTVKNPYEKTSVFTCYIRTFSASTGRSYMSSVFFHKSEGCVLQGCNFIKKLVHHRLFSQNIVF